MDRLERLEMARDALEAQIRLGVASLPQVVREYRATLAEIAELSPAEPEKEATVLDEFTARLAARKPGAAGRGRA